MNNETRSDGDGDGDGEDATGAGEHDDGGFDGHGAAPGGGRDGSLRFAWAIATWFGCGKVPKAPGTMGTLGAIPLYLLVSRGGQVAVAATALVVTAVGIWAADVVARDLGKKDPQVVVVDEVAGLLVTMLPMRPMADISWRAIVVGFLLFRLFDVTKPWPVRGFEKLRGGWGIVMDDVFAGIYGACVIVGLRAVGALP
ncbi:MAG TPA: phosphatidylglycerophosphatase A [Polyangiaceae bacterium]|jgi:phosphatidylglycerophosphatase A|nr:phosphatidylglycerophosphatase A [Polyangiaceae bacterium]